MSETTNKTGSEQVAEAYEAFDAWERRIEAKCEDRGTPDGFVEWWNGADIHARTAFYAMGFDVPPASRICGIVCECGAKGEPIACGLPPGHNGEHAWASLPTVPA